MIAAVSALFDMSEIVFLTFYFHICSSSDNGSYCINIFLKLTDDPDSCKILHLSLHLLDGNMLALHLLQDTGDTLYPSTDLFNGGITIVLTILFYHMFKFDCQFLDSQLIRAQNTSP